MRIYVINLLRHRERRCRMKMILAGLDAVFVDAVDGRNLAGLEFIQSPRGWARRVELTRYERALIESHRNAWRQFLDTDQNACCILEDDVLLSERFRSLVGSDDWVPADARLVKLETMTKPVFASRAEISIPQGSLRRLRSLHLGAAAYVVTRAGALVLLAMTEDPGLPLDDLIFSDQSLASHPTYQVCPAVCIQADKHTQSHEGFLVSTIVRATPRKYLLMRIKAELHRPLVQLATVCRRLVDGTFRHCERMTVPFE